MKLDRVTLTGADDSVHPADLVKLSQRYPFVEWGILFLLGGAGNRFPSIKWTTELIHVMHDYPTVNLAAHLCGGWVDSMMLYGKYSFGKLPIANRFSRVQVNTHGATMPPSAISGIRSAKRPFIFQCDGTNNGLVRRWVAEGLGAPLFDMSSGAGVLPDTWPHASDWPEGTYLGYAGGLGPANVREQLTVIGSAAGSARIWIDMETRLRSDNDVQFDLAKCEAVLDTCAPFITKEA